MRLGKTRIELQRAERRMEEFQEEFDANKAAWGYDGNPNGWAAMQAEERRLLEQLCDAQDRCRGLTSGVGLAFGSRAPT